MKFFGEVTGKIALALFALVCSRALLAIFHSFGWYPEQQLTELLLASPSFLQRELALWLLLAVSALVMWFAIDYLVYQRDLTHAWRSLRATVEARPHVDYAPGVVFTKLKKHWKAEWRATPEAIKGGFKPRTFQIYRGPRSEFEDPAVKDYIAHRCKAMEGAMNENHSGTRADEPSMEEVLAAIRRVIAPEDAEVKK